MEKTGLLADTPDVSHRFLRWTAAACAAVIASYYVLITLPGTVAGPGGATIDVGLGAADGMFVMVGYAAAIAVLMGVRRNRPHHAGAWYLQAAGLGLWATGDAMYVVFENVLNETPSPSIADAAYLLSYPFLAIGLAGVARGRRGERDAGGLIDSAIFAVGALSTVWVFLIEPALTDPEMSSVGRGVSAAYPVMDVLLLGVLVRLLTGPSRRPTAVWVLAGAASAFLLADTAFSVATVLGVDGDVEFSWAWLLGYVLWAAAALHPSMATLSREDRSDATHLTTARVVGVTLAAMAPAVTLVLLELRGQRIQVWAIVLSWVVLFSLVMLRVVGLIRRIEQQRETLARVARTDALTGLPNRRSGDAELRRAMDSATATGAPLHVAMIDLDHFKRYNDTHGHQAGDELLVTAGESWSAGLTPPAFLARHGGEEFLLVVPGSDGDHVADTLQMMRGVLPPGTTLSAGVARWDGREDHLGLLERTDAALYAAKAAGRDRVEWARDEDPAPVG